MKKVFMVLVLVLCVSVVQAAVISANFTSDSFEVTPTASHGLSGYQATNWNNVDTTGAVNWYDPTSASGLALNDNTGADSGATVSYGPAWTWYDGSVWGNDNAGTVYLNGPGWADPIPTITVTNVPYDLYTVIVYHGTEEGANEATGFAPVTVNGALQAACTNSGTFGTVGGWVDGRNSRVVTGLTDSTMTIDIASSIAGSDATIAGFQIVEVPEPATMALLSLGSLALIRRKKCK